MIVAPGVGGASLTVILNSDEKCPRVYNRPGPLVFRESKVPGERWIIIKAPDTLLEEIDLQPIQEAR
jgi:hypothetical protein